MSDDKYPRVERTPARDWYELDEGALPVAGQTHKAVPYDAIVIERSDLPEVVTTDGTCGPHVPISGRGHLRTTPETARAEMLAAVALAEYHREHPLAEEARVEALAEVLYQYEQNLSGRGDSWHEADAAERNRWLNRAYRVISNGLARVEVAP